MIIGQQFASQPQEADRRPESECFTKLIATLSFALLLFDAPGRAEPVHGIALYGTPKQPPGFTHFSYVNPDAPKGGRLVLGAFGSFDSLNPLIIKGVAANGIRDFTIESLMARGLDEPFTLYGLVAETVEVPEDRSSITFHLNPKAHFSDGKPITADDVLFSLELLKEKGRPNHRTYFAKVAKAERLSDRSVRFTFDAAGDREIPLILGLLPVLPKHAINPDTYESTSLEAPVGSGPYRVGKIDAGPLDHLRARRKLLGPRSAGEPRPLQLRRDPLRLLPRRLGDVRRLQVGADRPVAGGGSAPLGQRLRLPRHPRRSRREARVRHRACRPA